MEKTTHNSVCAGLTLCHLHPHFFKVPTWNQKTAAHLGGKTLNYFALSQRDWGAVNLASQKQLSESRGMRGRRRQREERRRETERDGERHRETQRVRHKGSLGSLC